LLEQGFASARPQNRMLVGRSAWRTPLLLQLFQHIDGVLILGAELQGFRDELSLAAGAREISARTEFLRITTACLSAYIHVIEAGNIGNETNLP
jgi:hypothetical protein